MDSQHFSALIMMLSSQAMMTMGKLKNPVSDTIEKDLLASQFMIDMLESVQKEPKEIFQTKNKSILMTL